MTAVEEFVVELRRIVNRLNSLPLDRLTRADGLGPRCHAVAVLLADAVRALGSGAPDGVDVPMLAPSGWGAQLAVLGREYLDAAGKAVDESLVAALVELRRSLP